MPTDQTLSDHLNLFERRNLPIILQAEAAECGLACLAMVLAHFGHKASLSELRRRFSTSLKGATLQSVMNMADGLGLAARPLRLELNELAQVKCPAILHWDLKHFVVLKSVKHGRVTIHDPAKGQRTFPISAASAHFTGVALELTPTPNLTPKKDVERVKIRDLFGHVRGINGPLTQLFVLASITQVLALASPALNQTVVDNAIARGDLDLLSTVAVGMIFLLGFRTITGLLRGYVNMYLGNQLTFQVQTNLLRHVLRLRADWFEKRHVGDILSRFGSLGPVQNVFTSSAISIVLDAVMAVGTLILMVIYAPLLTLLECLTLLVGFAIRALTFPYLRSKTDQSLQLSARVQTTFLETIRGARTFKLFGRERQRVAVWQNEQAAVINNGVEITRFGLWGGAGAGILVGVQQIIIWYLGAKMVIEGKLTLGMLIAYQAYAGQFTAATTGLIGQVFTFRTMGLHLERLSDIVHADPEPNIDAPVDPAKPFAGGVELRNVSFRYAEHEPWVLQGVNLTVEPGEFVCFAGPSGHGKTTLMKILVGFCIPDEGEVLLDQVPLRSFGVRTYRDRIGVVAQDDHLFSGSIADNIAFFDPDADQLAIECAAELAQVHRDIASLPMGYLTLVGDMGATLSGGQRQRVLLARALYRSPSILFLDEGTANLDPQNESRVMDVIRSLPITRVVVAHRPGAREGADRLYWVENGKVELRDTD